MTADLVRALLGGLIIGGVLGLFAGARWFVWRPRGHA